MSLVTHLANQTYYFVFQNPKYFCLSLFYVCLQKRYGVFSLPLLAIPEKNRNYLECHNKFCSSLSTLRVLP